MKMTETEEKKREKRINEQNKYSVVIRKRKPQGGQKNGTGKN